MAQVEMIASGERVARLEEKIEAVHQDIHLIGDQFNRVWDAIEGVRKELISRPSWTVATLLAFLSSVTVASMSALVVVIISR